MQSSNLDFLRTCAVVCVALSHLYGYMGGPRTYAVLAHNVGVGGVVIFFVHTSLVLFFSMERGGMDGLVKKFYVRRFFRIYPLCWACITFVLITGLSDISPDRIAAMGITGCLINVLLVQNIVRVGSVVGPLWSLPWEVQMYVVLPFLFLLIKRKNKAFVPLGLWGLATVAAIVGTASGMPRAFHMTVVVPMFLGGMVAYQMRNIGKRLSAAWWPLAVIALIVARVALLHGDSFETQWNTLVNAVICIALGMSIPLFNDIRTPWIVRSSRGIAEYSYGIYLFHVPMLALCFDHFAGLPKTMQLLLWIGSTAAVTVFFYHAIERPFIRLGKSFFTSRQAQPHVESIPLAPQPSSSQVSTD